MKEKRKNPLLIFYVLLGYILIQFNWWMVQLYRLNKQLQDGNMDSKVWMIFGEGMVFFIILMIGFIYTIRSFNKEIKLSEQQNNFLLAVTHELKTPLSSIKLFFQTLRRTEIDQSKKEELITKGINDVDRLNNMIENLLLSARFEGDAHKIHKESCDLHELLEKLVEQARLSYGLKHEIQFQSSGPILIDSDINALSSIFINLIENSCKYSPVNGIIQIELLTKNDQVVIKIKDQGIGIKKTDLPFIFQKFYRVQNENTRTTKGTGLGLYIVNHLINLLNATISINNNLPQGSIFTITLQK